MKYNAFISYSQRKDARLASCLETALEKFAKPTFKRRALDVFRDSNDLSASPDLWGKIEKGLDESEYFIFLASEKSAQSRWCVKEVDYWLKTKSINQFLVVLTEGELHWDEQASDFDWEKTKILPPNLSGQFKNDPLYVDFRGDTPEAELTLEHPDFKDKVVRLAATLHGKSVGDMVGEAAEQYKRTMRIRNAAFATLSMLLIVAIISAMLAFHQKGVAESETRKARLSSYISASQAQLVENPTKSLRLVEHAYRYASENKLPTEVAAEQLLKVFYSGYGFYQQPVNEIPAKAEQAHQQGNSEGFAMFKQETSEILNNIEDHFYLGGPRTALYVDEPSIYLETSPNQAIFLVAGATLDFPRLYFLSSPVSEFDSPGPIEIKLEGFDGYTGTIRDAAISSNGRYSLMGAANGKAALIDNKAYREDYNNSDVFKTRSILISGDKNAVENVGFIDDGEYFFTHSETVSHRWKTEQFPYIEIRNNDTVEHKNISVSGGNYMVPVSESSDDNFTWFHYAQTVHDQNGDIIAEFPNATAITTDIVTSPGGNFLVSYQGIFNKNRELLIRLAAYFIDNPGIAYSFSLDQKYFKISYLDGPERIFALDPEDILARVNDREIMGDIAGLSEDDKRRFLIDIDEN